MIDNTFMDSVHTKKLFGIHTGHVSMMLHRLPDARLIWLNRRVMHLDPQYNGEQNPEQYKQHLLRQCAYAVPDETVTISHKTESISVTADRYGGEGIGRNGGSGRAAFVNGYHIKGIGRTPLVSPLTDQAHASGGAYLEECARESVLSEIVDAEFPYGSVPVLAIIDTGFVQIWETDNGPKPERRCLLVRPAFLRPAHFMRALEYIGHNPNEGMKDAQRVALMIQQACTQLGSDLFSKQWEAFWLHWAEQLAHAYIHRINHGGNSESNISLDGCLLDFGAMTAVPNWARIMLVQGGAPTGADMRHLVDAQHSVAAMFAKHWKQNWTQAEKWYLLQASAIDTYKNKVIFELLRVLGLTRNNANCLLSCKLSETVSAAGNRLLGHYMREQFAIFDGMPEPHFEWDVPSFWHAAPPRHLQELRGLIERAMAIGIFGDATNHLRSTWITRCHMLSQTRTGLFRDNIKDALYKNLDGAFTDKELTEEQVTRVIDSYVLKHRIDSKIEPVYAAPLGFASTTGAGYALFKDLIQGDIFALQEWSADGSGKRIEGRILVHQISNGQLKLANSEDAEINAHLRGDEKILHTIQKQVAS